MNGAAPPVSVCLPSHNYAPYLRRCIDSVLEQTYSDFELIIVDDASTDDSVEIIQSYRDPRLRVERHTRCLGAVATWNHCLGLARGTYVSFVCADDFFLPDKLQHQVDVLRRDPATGLVHSDGYWVAEDGHRESAFSKVFPPDLRLYLANDHTTPAPLELRRLAAGYNYIHLSSAMFDRRGAAEVGGFRTCFPYAADWDLWLRLVATHAVGCVAKPLAAYRRHRRNLTLDMQRSGQALQDWYGVTKATLERWPKQAGESDSVRTEAYRVIREHLLARVHSNYAQGLNPAVRRDLRLGFRHDPRLFANSLAVATYLKSLLGGKRTEKRIRTWLGRGWGADGRAS